jgi:hypothetical protein
MSTEGAEERLAIGMGIAAPLIGALVAATGVLPVDAVADVVADRDAMLRGAAQHTVVQFAGPEPADEPSAGEPAAGKPGTVPAPAATHVVAR